MESQFISSVPESNCHFTRNSVLRHKWFEVVSLSCLCCYASYIHNKGCGYRHVCVYVIADKHPNWTAQLQPPWKSYSQCFCNFSLLRQLWNHAPTFNKQFPKVVHVVVQWTAEASKRATCVRSLWETALTPLMHWAKNKKVLVICSFHCCSSECLTGCCRSKVPHLPRGCCHMTNPFSSYCNTNSLLTAACWSKLCTEAAQKHSEGW